MTLTAENIASEVAYFKAPGRISYERPYGWGWLLKLTAELATWDHPVGEKWFGILKPLAQQVVKNYTTYLPGLYYPLRRGVHANTAFGMAFALDYARVMGDHNFEQLLLERSRFYFLKDQNIPASWEPEGDDFFSPSLIEADLMHRMPSLMLSRKITLVHTGWQPLRFTCILQSNNDRLAWCLQ